MTGIRTRDALKTLTDTNLPSGTGAISAANHRELFKSGADSALHLGDGEVIVKQIALSAPPGGESDRDAYVVASGGTGEWAGQDFNIAIFDNSISPAAWFFLTPIDGQSVWNQSDDTQYRWDPAVSPTDWTAMASVAPTPFKGVRVYHSAVHALTSTPAALAFDSESFDTSTLHDTVTNNDRLTVDSTGYWEATGQLSTDLATPEWEFAQVSIDLDGATNVAAEKLVFENSAGWDASLSVQVSTGPLYLAAGQYLQLKGALIPDANSKAGEYDTWFSMRKVS